MLFILNSSFLIVNCFSQWLLQPWPVTVSGIVYDIKFFDNNVGIASMQNPVVIRTTNGGQNWQPIFYSTIYKLQKINDSIMYACGRPVLQNDRIYRTFNKGLIWDSVGITGYGYRALYFINKDTGFISGSDGNNHLLLKTTNGGLTLNVISTSIAWGVIFFLNFRINDEYYGWITDAGNMYKTTNSGDTWYQVGGAGWLWQLEFINENTGFATNPGGTDMMKTTNGGLNWISYVMPNGNGIVINEITNFKLINENIIYGDAGVRQFPNNGYRGIIWKSTNGGVNWGFQQPDTSYHYGYGGIDFTDSLNGWSSFIHTTNGGGPIIYTGVINNSNEIPNDYILKQNYPNPFNPFTTIEFLLPKDSYVKLKIFDITGKTVFVIINDFFLNAGNHKYTIDAFNTLGLSSGIYFYRLEATQRNKNNNVFTETKKMLYIK
jgi:photosystem II stability/assembly factor-like uncharacterized protein